VNPQEATKEELLALVEHQAIQLAQVNVENSLLKIRLNAATVKLQTENNNADRADTYDTRE
jgi:hypothetical protein